MAKDRIGRFRKRLSKVPTWARIGVTITVVVLLIATSLNLSGISFSKDSHDLVPFNADRSFRDIQYLTSLGSRNSGTEAEHSGAEYIADQMETAGLSNVHIEDYEKLLFEVARAKVSLVNYGPGGLLPLPWNANIVEFEHKVDFVVQGYSGSYDWMNFNDDLDIVDIGNGSDENAWDAAAGKAAVIHSEIGVSSNTKLFDMAGEHGLGALVLHNIKYHEELNYIPIFKTTGLMDGATTYPDIPFFMVSRDMGNEILASGMNGSKLRVDFKVIREIRTLKVVVGDVPGSDDSNRYVMVGAHDDTVYDGPGAVDNTCGTATVLEMARNIIDERPRPKRTIRFVTWGGEEEGLFGSGAYTEAHEADLEKNLIFYENLDMPNIDITRGNDGWIGTNDNGTLDTYNDILKKVVDSNSRFEKYNITIEYHALDIGSDQAPFAAKGWRASFGAGSGSWEYHTYLDDITHVNSESQELFGMIFSAHLLYLAQND